MEARTTTVSGGRDVVSGTNTLFEFSVKRLIALNTVNRRTEHVDKWTGLADYVRSTGQIQVDGKYFWTSTYSEGAGMFQIENDGQITQLWNGSKFLNNYTYHYYNLTVSPAHQKFWIGTYVQDGLAMYDYSTPTQEAIDATKRVIGSADGMTGNQRGCGVAYLWSPMAVAGDWLYYGGTTDQITTSRWNIVTEANEEISILNGINSSHWTFFYDQPNDRMYTLCHTSSGPGHARIIADASTASPTGFHLTTNESALGSYPGSGGFGVWVDPADADHIIMTGYYGRVAEWDISAVMAGTTSSPTFVGFGNGRYPHDSIGFYPSGYNHFFPHPDHDDYMIQSKYGLHSSYPNDGGYGWLDLTHGDRVATSRGDNLYWYADAPTGTDGDLMGTDGRPPINHTVAWAPNKVQSDDGTIYWVNAGYGGHSSTGIFSWAAHQDFTLETSGDVVFGSYQLESTANITHVQVACHGLWQVPLHAALSCQVSNDSGTTWEEYDYQAEELHEFASVGNTVQVKFILSGNGRTSPYYQGHYFPTITMLAVDKPLPRPTSRHRTEVKGVLL